jgi:5,10-methylenetetrahydromethanopterin reductase
MRFGASLSGDPATTTDEARLLESNRFDGLWFPDVPLLGWGDPYVAMALAAEATERVSIGTYVMPASLHATPAVVSQFAALNRLAPGRIVLGYGSGSVTRGILGMPELRVRDLREELVVIRDLLDRQEASVDGGRIKFYDFPRPALNFEDRIRVAIAASGPRTAALAGELGDALITAGERDVNRLRALLGAALEGAGAAPGEFEFAVGVGGLCVVRDGEPLDAPRIISRVQPGITQSFAFSLQMNVPAEAFPEEARDAYSRYRAWVAERYGPERRAQVQGVYNLHLARDPEQDQFVTPETIRALTMTGTANDLAQRLRALDEAGVTEVIVTRSLDRPWVDDEDLADLLGLIDRIREPRAT